MLVDGDTCARQHVGYGTREGDASKGKDKPYTSLGGTDNWYLLNGLRLSFAYSRIGREKRDKEKHRVVSCDFKVDQESDWPRLYSCTAAAYEDHIDQKISRKPFGTCTGRSGIGEGPKTMQMMRFWWSEVEYV